MKERIAKIDNHPLLKKLPYIFLILSAILFLSGIAFSVSVISSISDRVDKTCDHFRSFYSGDCVERLTKAFVSHEVDFYWKNEATWTMGKMGDDRAIRFLEAYQIVDADLTAPCNRELELCQKEISNSIELCKNSENLLAYFWRRKHLPVN